MAVYRTKVGEIPDFIASAKNNKIHDPIGDLKLTGRLILKGGRVIDPKNRVDEVSR